jgi:hypothetical protein
VREAGCPGGGDAEDGDEAAEEDGFAAVLGDEALASGEVVLGVAAREFGSVEESASAFAATQ